MIPKESICYQRSQFATKGGILATMGGILATMGGILAPKEGFSFCTTKKGFVPPKRALYHQRGWYTCQGGGRKTRMVCMTRASGGACVSCSACGGYTGAVYRHHPCRTCCHHTAVTHGNASLGWIAKGGLLGWRVVCGSVGGGVFPAN